MKKQNWKDINQVFETLNQHCNYVILRNYEELDTGHIVMEDHDDIDFLCMDQREMRKLLGAVYRPVTGNYDHFFIKVDGQDVKLGIRYVGDNYYDEAWEKKMLQTRTKHPAGFYVMNDVEYFYSLLYHAFVQKKEIAEDYKVRLREMANNLGIFLDSEEDFIECLNEYMKQEGYQYTYPKDPTIPLQTNRITNMNPVGFGERQIRHWLRLPIRVLRFIYRRIRRKK